MNNKRSAARKGGYSLVELMVTLSVAATLAAVAVPAFGTLVQDHRRTTIVNELMATLMFARSEAAKRGRPVVVCGFDDANGNGSLDPAEQRCSGHDWSDGWIAAAWNDADGDGVVDDAELAEAPLRQHVIDRGQVTVTAGNFTVTPPVAPAGTAVLKPFAQRCGNGTITVCDRRGAGAARAIIVSANGRSRITTRNSAGQPLACP